MVHKHVNLIFHEIIVHSVWSFFKNKFGLKLLLLSAIIVVLTKYLSFSFYAIFLKKIPHRQDEEPRVGTYISTISGKAKIYEKVSAQILDFVGELDWEPTVHGISTYFSAQQNDFYYSLEKHNVENTELYGGYIIEPDLLEEAFDIQLSKSFFFLEHAGCINFGSLETTGCGSVTYMFYKNFGISRKYWVRIGKTIIIVWVFLETPGCGSVK